MNAKPEKSYIVKGCITVKVEVFNAQDREDAEDRGFELIADLLECTGYASDFNLEWVEVEG